MLRGVAAGWPTRMKRPTAARTDSYLSRMVTYIPTEIIAGYVAVSGFIKTLPAPRQFAWFCAVTLFLLVLTPLYLRYVDLWDAVEALRDVLATRAWDRPEFKQRAKVT